ncbi:insulinase family protein [Acidobacteriia bacterium AH_259_A11_L15]|nr:insulinase family protein [Acidobacteriia bacterium AH_259_A11_L15]
MENRKATVPMRSLPIIWLTILLGLAVAWAAPAAEAPQVVTLDSSAPLLEIRVMVKAGAADDPQGLEGLAYLTGRLLIEGAFGDPENPVTKDRLAEITRAWGGGAYPDVDVSKEVSVFSMTVPREVLDTYLEQVLRPMFTRPLFAPDELDRVRAETLTFLRSGRLEQIELVGLIALDNVIHQGTGYAHPDLGTEMGLQQVTAEAVRRFYATYYTPENIVIGVSSAEPAIVKQVQEALSGVGRLEAASFRRRATQPPAPVRGREVLIVALPNAISTGLHAGFPLPITRAHPDYWPLYVANIWLGTHRDSFSHLYQVIRARRGYNYGDYSYIEHFEGRPFNLFPPTNSPRRYQYFSIWIRPVQHDYVHHLLKALTWELENFVRTGLSEEQCALAKNKARVLYLSLAETPGRLLGYRLDDAFYGMEPGYLGGYLETIDAVSCAEVNAAIRNYLQAENLRYVIITHKDEAPKLAAAIAAGDAAWGKSPLDYRIDVVEEGGKKIYQVPADKLELLRRDAAWAHHWLDIPRQRIRIVPAETLFRTAALPE